ncbi:putative calcium-binding protein CML48 [Drosera capensis]
MHKSSYKHILFCYDFIFSVMSSYSYPYNNPSAPPPPNDYNTTTTSNNNHYPPHTPSRPPQTYRYGSYPLPPRPQQSFQYWEKQQSDQLFPPGMDTEVIRVFQMVDSDRSGIIDEHKLQRALSSSGYQRFRLRTVRLLMFLFKDGRNSSPRIGPREFGALWDCLGEWRAIFERFDRDRSGNIDANELRDALHSLGYAVPPSVLQFLISHYDDRSGRKVELGFDSFIECGMIIKGMTEKFKEHDPNYTGSATLPYDTFMSMVLPFMVTHY